MSRSDQKQPLREEFQRKGFVRIPRSVFHLDEAEIKMLRNEFARLFEGQYDTGIYPDEIHWRPGISRSDATKEICNAWKASSAVRQIVCSKTLGRLACELMGWSSSRLGQDDVLHKPPRGKAVGFHQDGAYISDNFLPRENNSLTMWIALDDADEETGALQYAVGSHLWPDAVTAAPTASFHTQKDRHYMTPLYEAAAAVNAGTAKDYSVETVSVPAGEMVVHHQRVWHGSDSNKSETRHRRALVAHLLDGEVKWADSPKYIYGRYCIRGESVPREDFFPVTYTCDEALDPNDSL